MKRWRTWASIPMLVQRCALDQHRLILPVSVSKPTLQGETFLSMFTAGQYRALVDTGAQRTVVSRAVIRQLGLLRTGHMEFGGLHGPRTHSRYLASIGIWARRLGPTEARVDLQDCELTLFTVEPPFEVVDMADNANFELILGFDVLKQFSFGYDQKSGLFEITVQP